MADILRLDGVSAGYGQTVILDDLSLMLPAGGLLAVLGRNGVGKSTLMKTIIGQTQLHRGTISFDGNCINSLASHLRSDLGVGYVPQERNIFASLTVEENLLVAARPGRWTVQGVFELFPNLGERRKNRGNEISGGEQQMLTIGRALVGNSRLLLLDEPMEGLAPVIVDELLAALGVLCQDGSLAIILVEQYVRLALEFAPRTVVLDRGRIVFDGESARLAADPEMMATLLGASGAVSEERTVAAG